MVAGAGLDQSSARPSGREKASKNIRRDSPAFKKKKETHAHTHTEKSRVFCWFSYNLCDPSCFVCICDVCASCLHLIVFCFYFFGSVFLYWRNGGCAFGVFGGRHGALCAQFLLEKLSNTAKWFSFLSSSGCQLRRTKQKEQTLSKREMATTTSNYLWIIALLTTAILQVSVIWRQSAGGSLQLVFGVIYVSISNWKIDRNSRGHRHSTMCVCVMPTQGGGERFSKKIIFRGRSRNPNCGTSTLI